MFPIYFTLMQTVSIIGAGRMGLALALNLPKDRFRVRHLIYRGAGLLPELQAKLERHVEVIRLNEFERSTADILLFAVQDQNISPSADWASENFDSAGYAFHTSGALGRNELSALRNIGASLGSIHPLVSVSSVGRMAGVFNSVHFCLEGDEKAVGLAEEIARSLGGIPFHIESEFKTLYHAAAVTSCGHMVALLDVAFEMLGKCGLDQMEARQIMIPLIESTFGNLREQSAADAMTGTFARADVDTFAKHVAAINAHCSDEVLEIYLLLGERALQLATQKGINPERVESMRARVALARARLK